MSAPHFLIPSEAGPAAALWIKRSDGGTIEITAAECELQAESLRYALLVTAVATRYVAAATYPTLTDGACRWCQQVSGHSDRCAYVLAEAALQSVLAAPPAALLRLQRRLAWLERLAEEGRCIPGLIDIYDEEPTP